MTEFDQVQVPKCEREAGQPETKEKPGRSRAFGFGPCESGYTIAAMGWGDEGAAGVMGSAVAAGWAGMCAPRVRRCTK